MKKHTKKIVILIPCHNEAEGIADVIRNFPYKRAEQTGYTLEIIVIDNNSTDRTAAIAAALGVAVLSEERTGKGNAMRLGFRSVPMDADYVAMIDGDHTYHASELLRLVEPLDSDFCNVVIGSRLAGKISNDAMTFFNRTGNWVFSHLVRYFYRANVTDVLTGYYAWKREALMRLHPQLTAKGFGIEMEMVTKMARMKEEIYCVPISYTARSGDSSLRPIYDGVRILAIFVRNLFWQPATSDTHQETVAGNYRPNVSTAHDL